LQESNQSLQVELQNSQPTIELKSKLEKQQNNEVINEFILENKMLKKKIEELSIRNKEILKENEKLIKNIFIVQSTLKDFTIKLSKKQKNPSKRTYDFRNATARDVVENFYNDLCTLSKIKNRKIKNLIEIVTQIFI
jgi:hypothetical protein